MVPRKNGSAGIAFFAGMMYNEAVQIRMRNAEAVMGYTEERLKALVGEIAPPDERAMEEARKRQAQLAKPPGSLGQIGRAHV